MLVTKNATIESAQLSAGDYGCLSAWLMLNYGDGSGQGFGGYILYRPKTARTLYPELKSVVWCAALSPAWSATVYAGVAAANTGIPTQVIGSLFRKYFDNDEEVR